MVEPLGGCSGTDILIYTKHSLGSTSAMGWSMIVSKDFILFCTLAEKKYSLIHWSILSKFPLPTQLDFLQNDRTALCLHPPSHCRSKPYLIHWCRSFLLIVAFFTMFFLFFNGFLFYFSRTDSHICMGSKLSNASAIFVTANNCE